MSTPPQRPHSRHRFDIESHLRRVTASPEFGGDGTNFSKLLRFLVECAINGDTGLLFEKSIGERALGRRQGYDAKSDRIVSVTKNRLVSEKLPAYYAGTGRHDRVRFHVPARGYLVEIEVLPDQFPSDLLLAHHAALRAYDTRDAGAMFGALDRLRQVVTSAPGHGPSWALIAEITFVVANHFADPRIFLPLCQEAAQRALALDDRLWRAHLAAAGLAASMLRDWPTAHFHAEAALRLAGSQVASNHLYAAVMIALGRGAQAIASLRMRSSAIPSWRGSRCCEPISR